MHGLGTTVQCYYTRLPGTPRGSHYDSAGVKADYGYNPPSTSTYDFGQVIMGVQKAYNDWSASYDSDENLTRDLDQNVLREALADLHFKSILEIGCGTGKNTAFLSQISERVHALDFSEGMVEKAR